MKLTRGNTAERHAFQIVFRCQFQAGAVAGGEQFLIRFGHAPVDDRADGVQHIAAGQIERRGDLCLTGGLGITLLPHQLRTSKAQLHARKGVNGVVDATVVRNIAAGHAAVGSVDDSITPKRCNVTLPEIQSRLNRRQVVNIGNALCCGFSLQIFVLCFQKLSIHTPGRTNIHQSPQKLALALRLCLDTQIPIFRAFFQK